MAVHSHLKQGRQGCDTLNTTHNNSGLLDVVWVVQPDAEDPALPTDDSTKVQLSTGELHAGPRHIC